MNPEANDEVQWLGWIVAVTLAPIIPYAMASIFSGTLRGPGSIHIFLTLLVGACILSVAWVSVDQARALARRRGIVRIVPRLLLWLGLTLLGMITSTAIWTGTCAVIMNAGRVFH